MMNDTVKSVLSELKAGTLQSHGRMTVLPLFDPTPRTLKYITLSRALVAGRFKITEISEGGSVSELMAINEGEDHVLLLDSEEVAGAKQNRVFNSSILVAARSKIRIPVSCTEQGRWGYRQRDFIPSGNFMPSRARASKKAYVSASLRTMGSYAGDQDSVWSDVRDWHYKMGTSSPTGAMEDIFEGRRADIEVMVRSFKPEQWQSGMAVSVNGRLVGFDYVSNQAAFADIFPRLIRSYAIEGLASGGSRASRRMHEVDKEVAGLNLLDQVIKLVDDPRSATESLHRSVGLGQDYRYSSSRLVGSALIHEDEVAHMALLPNDGK